MTNQQPSSFESGADDEGYEGPDVEMPVDGDSGLGDTADDLNDSADSGLGDTADDLNDSADSYVSPARTGSDGSGEPKPDGLGQDGTIPDEPDGVAAGYTGEPSTFEPEEDGQSDG